MLFGQQIIEWDGFVCVFWWYKPEYMVSQFVDWIFLTSRWDWPLPWWSQYWRNDLILHNVSWFETSIDYKMLKFVFAFQTIRQQILEFASPVSRHHGVNMLGAVAVVWTDRRQRNTTSKRVGVYLEWWFNSAQCCRVLHCPISKQCCFVAVS